MSKPRYSEAAELLQIHLRELGVELLREYRFDPGRRWRFDFIVGRRDSFGYADLERKIAIEIEGGIHVGGRHTRGVGYQDDLDKHNAAVALGWRVFHFSTRDVLKGKARKLLEPMLRREVAHGRAP